MMKFIITTQSLPAKKNDIEISCRGKFPVKYKSQKLRDFEEEAAWQMISQKKKYKDLPIDKPVMVNYNIFLNHRFNSRDVDNIISTLSDILQDNGIIKNDALVIAGTFQKQKIDPSEIEKAEIEIMLC